ncbi:diguanylate cyclase [Ferrimonas sp. SCSIO 43195]|uniref:GGDEF domain-containing protein n=1 Tax=Ferrimonas sp. SCSIO 43195 TaxID=2822844 RepID=UPI0020752C43|nr:diguanylate cyclase [Ferrimonas sp. SCSIO 43195]USD37670.1 sensor domain-containing diguanylate cyclase [Ferrimonas sp. SCSIO 43195]
MFNSRVFLYFPMAAMIAMMSVALLMVSLLYEHRLHRHSEARLHHLAQLGVSMVRHHQQRPEESLDGLLAQVIDRSGSQMLVLDSQGNILADSQGQAEDLSGRFSLEERQRLVQGAELEGGGRYRFDPQRQQRLHYVTARVDSGDSAGSVVLVSEPSARLDNLVLMLRFWVLLVWAGCLVAIALTSIVFGRWMRRQTAAETETLEVTVVARTRELTMLQRLGSLMSACTSVSGACHVLEPIASQLLPGTSGAIALLKVPKGKLELVASWGGPWGGRDRFSADECWALLKGHAHLSREEGLEIHCEHYRDDRSCQLCIPLLAQGEALGVLQLSFLDEALMLDSRPMAESLAEQVGLALANIRLRDNLRQQAIRDPLTGLFNRRHMIEFLENQLALSARQHAPLSILMLDIDHFKRFNDTFGHDAGDFVIKLVAEEIGNQVRKSDLVCRYGGEELVVICPDTEVMGAQELARKIIAAVAAMEYNHAGQSLGQVTLSAGVSCTQGAKMTIEALMKDADDALYKAKQGGRNRVELATGLEASLPAAALKRETTEPG